MFDLGCRFFRLDLDDEFDGFFIEAFLSSTERFSSCTRLTFSTSKQLRHDSKADLGSLSGSLDPGISECAASPVRSMTGKTASIDLRVSFSMASNRSSDDDLGDAI